MRLQDSFFWQGEKDLDNEVHTSRYEQNLVRFIKQLRKDFNAPEAKFVLATLGEAVMGCGGTEWKVLERHLAEANVSIISKIITLTIITNYLKENYG